MHLFLDTLNRLYLNYGINVYIKHIVWTFEYA